MTRALSIVESILRSDKSDLKDLAEIAGLDPKLMYLDADLTGVDLRNQDISFLVGLNTNFEAAIITAQQRDLLRKGRSQERGQQTRRSIRDARLKLVLTFLEEFPDKRLLGMQHEEFSSEEYEIVKKGNLRRFLLDPIVNSTSPNPNDQFGSDYMSSVLSGLWPWVVEENLPFFEELFTLLGELHCPVDGNVLAVIKSLYLNKFEYKVGFLLSCMRPTRDLDSWWVVEMAPRGERTSHAIQISNRRKVHSYAVDAFVSQTTSLDEKIYFLTEVRFDVDFDLAERLALYIVNSNWIDARTEFVLKARLPKRVSNAIFRQLLAQGNERRIASVLTWLNDNRGAAGALSLENAIVHIKDFDLLHQLALKFAPHMKANQLKVIDNALSGLAYRDQDAARLRDFRRKVGIRVPTRPP